VQTGSVPTFGVTGDLHDGTAGLVTLRARWYTTRAGTFTAVDPFAGFAEQPYSQHPYQYAYSNPVVWTDPSGQVSIVDDGGGAPVDPDAQKRFLCVVRGGMWDEQTGRCDTSDKEPWDDANYECIGNPSAIEVRIPLLDGSTAPVCLNAPRTEVEQVYDEQKNTPKQPVFIVDPLGNLICADSGSNSQDEEESTQLGQSSFLPDLGIPAAPDWLKKLKRNVEGYLRPNKLRAPKTWQEAEDMVSKFTGVRSNRKPQERIPVPGEGRRSAPDFVGPDFLGESKFLQDTAELELKVQQRNVAKIAKARGVPYYVFVTEGKIIGGLSRVVQNG
jgi:RHS repeat-associated protein